MSTIGNKLVKQQYVLHMSSQYGELRPTSGWDRSGSLRHPCKFQRVSRLGSVTARHLLVGVSQTLRPMPNVMVALPNIGGALCSTPQLLSCWKSYC